MKRALLAAVALAALAYTADAHAQELRVPAPRQGYYLGAGFRQALLLGHSEKVGGLGPPMFGGAFALRAGQMASESIGFGIAIASGGGGNDDWTGGYGGLFLEGQLVPFPNTPEEGLAIRAAIGLGGISVERKEEALRKKTDPKGGGGPIYTVGFSYDWFPFWDKGDTSGGFAFTPFVEVEFVQGDALYLGGMLGGLELTYWFGLSDDHLVETSSVAR